MFGFSFSEVLLVAVVAAGVWFAWKRARRLAGRSVEHGADTGPKAAVEDMVKCPICSLYVPAKSPTACEREDCPYRG
jgi:hypothetical protein